jgi:hypothetical protein
MPVVRPRHDGVPDAAPTAGVAALVPARPLPGVLASGVDLPELVDLPRADAGGTDAPVVVQVETGPIHWDVPAAEASGAEEEPTVATAPPSARPAADLAPALNLASPAEADPALPGEPRPPALHGSGALPLPLPQPTSGDATTGVTEPGLSVWVAQEHTATPLDGGTIDAGGSGAPARPAEPPLPAGLPGGPRDVARPLTPQLEVARRAVEQRTGVPLGDVPIHRDLAPGVARRLGAQAYTDATGVHLPVEIGTGTSSRAGALLAHELTHAAQRKRSTGPLPAEHSGPGRHLEAEARGVERAVAAQPAQPARPPGALFESLPFDAGRPSRLTLADQATVPARELPLAEARPSPPLDASTPFEGSGLRADAPVNGSPASMVFALPRREPAASPAFQDIPLDRYLALTQDGVAQSTVSGAGPMASPAQQATVTFPPPAAAAQAPGDGGWAASAPHTGASGMQRAEDDRSAPTSTAGTAPMPDDSIEALLDQIFPSLTYRLRNELRRERDAWGHLTGLL